MAEQLTSIPSLFFSQDNKRLSPVAYAFLFILCISFFLPGLTSLPPTDRDESSFAQASKQMMETSNYVDIRLQDKPRYKKPIGIYWLQVASVKLLNPNHLSEIWAYRVPSMLGATLSVLMTAALGSLLFGPTTGLLAAFMMAGCVLLNVEARLAKTDAVLLSSIMVAQYALAWTYMKRPKSWLIVFLFWTFLGVGILIKGPLILLVLFSTLLWLRIAEKNLSWFKNLKPLLGIPYLLALVAPWFIAITLQSSGAFIAQSAGNDLLAKLWQGQNRSILPPGVHLLAYPILFFPFSLFALLAAPDAWNNRKKPAVRFCLAWIIPTWIVFELSLTKLPHYVLPTYPALALLAAKALKDGYPSLAMPQWRWPVALATGLWIMIGTGFALLIAFLPFALGQSFSLPGILIGAFLILVQGFSLLLLFRGELRSVMLMTCGSLIFIAYAFGTLLPAVNSFWVSRQVMDVAEAVKPCDDIQITSASYGEPSLIFMAGTETRILPDGAAAALDMKANPCHMGLIDEKHRANFLNAFEGSPAQPVAAGRIEGLNIGHGHNTLMTLYLLKGSE